MEQVRVFRTKDGQLFDNRINAETHELVLNLRGIIQSQVKGTSFTPTEIATLLAKEQSKVFDTIGKYRRTVASVKASITRIGN